MADAAWPVDRPRRLIRRPSWRSRRIKQGGTALYYSADWQVLEERDGGGIARVSMVWSPVYIDAMIARDRDADTNGSLEERLYVAHDANFNVSSIINTSGSALERFIFDPYGSPTFLNGSWSVIGSSAYAWTHLHQGGRQSSASSLYHFRHRELSSTLGRWNRNDPILFRGDDTSLLRYVGSSPLNLTDPSGTQPPRKVIYPERPQRAIAEGGDERGWRLEGPSDCFFMGNDCPDDWYGDHDPNNQPKQLPGGVPSLCRVHGMRICRGNDDKVIRYRTVKALCDAFEDSRRDWRVCSRITVFGHGCGDGVGLGEGNLVPGAIAAHCARAIRSLLSGGGVFRICGCQDASSRQQVEEGVASWWRAIGSIPGISVCMCLGLAQPQEGKACVCRGEWICHPAKK